MKERKYINYKPGIKRRILIIGDHNLLGDYSLEGKLVGYKSWAWHLKKQLNEDHDIYTLPLPNCSFTQVNAILEYLRDSGLLDIFTHCIVSLPADNSQTLFTSDAEGYFKALSTFILTDRFLKYDLYDGGELYNRFLEPHIMSMSASYSKNNLVNSVSYSVFNKHLFFVNYAMLLDILKSSNVVPILFDLESRSVAQYQQIHTIRKQEDLNLYPNNSYAFTEPDGVYWSAIEMIKCIEFDSDFNINNNNTFTTDDQWVFAKTLYKVLADKLILDWIIADKTKKVNHK